MYFRENLHGKHDIHYPQLFFRNTGFSFLCNNDSIFLLSFHGSLKLKSS